VLCAGSCCCNRLTCLACLTPRLHVVSPNALFKPRGLCVFFEQGIAAGLVVGERAGLDQPWPRMPAAYDDEVVPEYIVLRCLCLADVGASRSGAGDYSNGFFCTGADIRVRVRCFETSLEQATTAAYVHAHYRRAGPWVATEVLSSELLTSGPVNCSPRFNHKPLKGMPEKEMASSTGKFLS
jgi:hypothetical protein